MSEILDSGSAGDARPAPMPFVSRVLGTMLSPSAVFQNLRWHPRLLGALLLSLVISLGSYAAIAPIINREQMTKITESIEKNENIPAGRKDEIIDQQAEMMAKPLIKALGYVSVAVVLLGFYALCALLLQLGCNFILGGQITFRQAFAGGLHAALPATLLGAVVKTPLILATQSLHAATSLALLLPEPNPASALYGALNAFDIFTVWTAVLVVMAGAGLTGFKTSRTRGLGVLFMVLAVVLGVIGALLQGLGS